MSRILNILSQIIALSKEAEKQLSKDNVLDAKKILKIISKLEKDELNHILDESGSQELYEECIRIYRDTEKIIKSECPKDETLKLLKRIINLENYEIKGAQKKGLDEETLRIIDPYIRELVNKINKLSFVDKTTYSCSGHFPYKMRPYIRIEYDANSKTKHNIHSFHDMLRKIVYRYTNNFLDEIALDLFNTHHYECGYFLGTDNASSVEILRDKILHQWQLTAKLVTKFTDNDTLTYKREKIELNKQLLDDDALRMVYCPKCNKYVYTDKKFCAGCGSDMRILKLQG